MSSHKIIVFDASDGGVETSATVRLLYGDNPINGRTPSAEANTYVETPALSGAYEVTVPETNEYTIEVNGAVQSEYTNVWLLASDVVTTAFLSSTTNGEGASIVGIEDAAGLITATNVEAALAELSGAGRTTETIKGAKDEALIATVKLAGVSSANLLTLIGGGNTTLHLHSDTYYTETEIDAWRGPTTGVISSCRGVTVDADGGGNPYDFYLDGDAPSGDNAGSNIFITTAPSGSSSTFGLVKINGYRIVTLFDLGDFEDLAGTHFIQNFDPTDYGIVKKCIVELDSRLHTLWIAGGGGSGDGSTWTRIFNSGSASATGAISADLAMVDYTRTANSYKICHRFSGIISNRIMYSVRLWVYAYMVGTGTKGYVRFSKVGGSGTEIAELTITGDGGVTHAWSYVDITLTQSASTLDNFTVEIKADASGDVHVSGHFFCEAQ